ncbi:MAG: hypothetical protein Q8N43_01500 [Candidatus Azambacteria bacterium]|nr:hypothetical protein [Candidatus Azambacteria bacterium]
MKGQILVKVWQGILTPEQAIRELTRRGPKLNKEEKVRILDLLLSLSLREITTTEVEKEIRYEYDRKPAEIKKKVSRLNLYKEVIKVNKEDGMVRVKAWNSKKAKMIYDYVKRSHIERLIKEGYIRAVMRFGLWIREGSGIY